MSTAEQMLAIWLSLPVTLLTLVQVSLLALIWIECFSKYEQQLTFKQDYICSGSTMLWKFEIGYGEIVIN